MPTLNIITNVPGKDVDAPETLKALSKAVADSVGKPEQWVMVSITTDKPMLYGGTDQPCAYGELLSIGSIGGEKNKAISAVVSAVLEARAGVAPARFYLRFTDSQRSDFGWNGGTF